MTAEALWNLFLRTGLPEAYSLYHQAASRAPEALREESAQAGRDAAHGLENKIPGT